MPLSYSDRNYILLIVFSLPMKLMECHGSWPIQTTTLITSQASQVTLTVTFVILNVFTAARVEAEATRLVFIDLYGLSYT